jgi:hypothetical protein
MNKIFTLILIIAINLGAMAQTADSVSTVGGANSVYYSFANGDKTSVANDDWEIGLTTKGFNASIIINEALGVKLFLYGNDIEAWNSVDTTGKTLQELFNSPITWNNGAFNRPGLAFPDYGWGSYNMSNHNVNGSRIFIIKLADDSYKKIIIETMSAAGVYTVKIANLDGSDEKTIDINKNAPEHVGRNYILYHIGNDSYSEEPLSNTWDLLFTRYMQRVQQGPIAMDYLVYGVKVNDEYQVAVRNDVSVENSDTTNLIWKDSITGIGADWKRFDRDIFQYVITADQTFFVRGKNGEIWKIWFTNFIGGEDGQFNFNYEVLNEGSLNIENINRINGFKFYPNPTSNQLNIDNASNFATNVKIYNIQMQELIKLDLNVNESKTVDVSGLSSGVYFITDGINPAQKLIIK